VNFVHNFRPFAAPSKCRPHPRIALATAPSNHGAGEAESIEPTTPMLSQLLSYGTNAYVWLPQLLRTVLYASSVSLSHASNHTVG